MDSELNGILSKDFLGSIDYCDCKGHFVLDRYERIANAIENFEIRDDDIWVCSFPRSGTTWTQEMVWNIANCSNSSGAKIPLVERFPCIELPGILPSWTQLFEDSASLRRTDMEYIGNIANSASPRFIKTHLPFHLLPRQLREREKNSKIIHVSRNPKDTCVSFYHLYKTYTGYCGTFDNFSKLFLSGKVICAPYWTSVNSYLKRKDDNILCIKFEDMKSDLPSVISKVAAFLDKTFSEGQMKNLENHLSFARMKSNRAVNRESSYAQMNATSPYGKSFACEQSFLRSGQVGEWKSAMSEELIEQFDDWIEENSNKF